MKFRIRIIAALAAMLVSTGLHAQFSTNGDDPARVRWNQMETGNFRIIYPLGSDSLARVYGAELERARILVSRSSGLMIGQSYKTKMPVILHGYYAYPNASVTWAPRRMDIYTVMDAYAPTPIPWERNLALHEGRHAAQMQFGAAGNYKVLHYITGELFAGAMAGLYPGPAFLEGDAVVAETALTSSGRGRQADFLGYMMPAFESGDWRDWYQWVYGSHRKYAPDHYRAGYMLISGARVFFDESSFTDKYFSRIIQKPRFFNLQKTVKEASGMKFKDAFRSIQESYSQMWIEEAQARSPFMPMNPVTPFTRWHTEYSKGTAVEGDGIYMVKTGLVNAGQIVNIGEDGMERNVRPFYATSSLLRPSGNRIYWTEYIPGRRWSLGSTSRVRYMDLSKSSRSRNLTRNGRFYNVAPSTDGKTLAAVEYPVEGGSRISLLSAKDGSAEETFISPDGLQFTETAWLGDRLFAAALSEEGMGIYEIKGKGQEGKAELACLAGPQPVVLSGLSAWKDGKSLSFVCDRTGVNELHLLDVSTLGLTQATNTRYGVSDPFLSESGETLYYGAVAASYDPSTYAYGKALYATPVADLPMIRASFDDVHKYKVADALTEQEKIMDRGEDEAAKNLKVTYSEPRKYSKLRLPHIHSWAPVWVNYDEVDSFSFDEYYTVASLGATVFFQNHLGTGYGYAGYGAHKDQDNDGRWQHSLHLNYTYSGLFPVFEFSLDFNDRQAMDIQRVQRRIGLSYYIPYNTGAYADRPYLEGSLRMYVPFNFSSGGVNRGLVPQVTLSLNNDTYNDQISLQDGHKEQSQDDPSLNYVKYEEYGVIGESNKSFLTGLSASLRGYVMHPAAESQTFPTLGIGFEAGFRSRPGHIDAFAPTAYLYTYGYLPGILKDQGLRITASYESVIGDEAVYRFREGSVTMYPRGMANMGLQSVIDRCSDTRLKFSLDYSIPLVSLDWSFLGPLAYIKNIELTPFFDYTRLTFEEVPLFYMNPTGLTKESLYSVGADLTLNLGNFLWLPYDTEVGIRYAYNSEDTLSQYLAEMVSRHYVRAIFTVSF